MIISIPPPLTGRTVVNAFVRERLIAMDAEPVVINIAPLDLNRGLFFRLGKLPKVLRGLIRLVLTSGRRNTAFYLSVSAGVGQAYDIAFLLVARLRGMRCFLHHHSFAYLGEKRFLTNALAIAAGRTAIHIALSDNMAERIKELYPVVKRVVSVSNASLYEPKYGPFVPNNGLVKTIGFLSNISEEKGVSKFLDVASVVERRGRQITFKLAGPFHDNRIECTVRERLKSLKSVEYVGPKYGKEKAAFFREIQVLLFPSVNEAEPNVVHEALMRGIPVIAYKVGCIGDVVTQDCGLVLERNSDIVEPAVRQIEHWWASPESYCAVSRAAKARFETLHTEALNKLEWLLHEICDAYNA